MKQSFDKGFVTPLPVFIIATYDKDGKPNAGTNKFVQTLRGRVRSAETLSR